MIKNIQGEIIFTDNQPTTEIIWIERIWYYSEPLKKQQVDKYIYQCKIIDADKKVYSNVANKLPAGGIQR